jgi:hypothetical protein
MEFNQKSGVSSPMDLIPRGYLCWAKVTMRGMKTSTTTGSRYAEVELTVADNQPFQRKKIFTKIGDPDYKENSEKYREMGMVSLTRMVEAAQIVNPEDAASYEKLNGKSCEAILIMLDGKYVAIKVKVEPGSQGYEDKNDVGEYLTPNAQSGSHKNYVKLTNGDHGSVGEQKKGGGFGGVPATTPTAPRPSGFQGGQAESAPAQTAQPPAEARGFNPNQAPAYLR